MFFLVKIELHCFNKKNGALIYSNCNFLYLTQALQVFVHIQMNSIRFLIRSELWAKFNILVYSLISFMPKKCEKYLNNVIPEM